MLRQITGLLRFVAFSSPLACPHDGLQMSRGRSFISLKKLVFCSRPGCHLASAVLWVSGQRVSSKQQEVVVCVQRRKRKHFYALPKIILSCWWSVCSKVGCRTLKIRNASKYPFTASLQEGKMKRGQGMRERQLRSEGFVFSIDQCGKHWRYQGAWNASNPEKVQLSLWQKTWLTCFWE